MQRLVDDIQFFLGLHDMSLLNPDGLALLLAAPVFVLLGFWMSPDMGWLRKLLVHTLRVAGVVALCAALCHPVRVKTADAPAVVLLADLSDSMSEEARERVRQAVSAHWEARGEAAAWLVGFGDSPFLLARPGYRRVGLPAGLRSSATDIAAALRFSYGLLPPKHDWRAVIFSDGEETRGDLLAEARRARELGIQVSAVPVLPPRTIDVRAERLDCPGSIRRGEELEIEAEIYASARRRIRIQLELDGERLERRELAARPGLQRVAFKTTVEREGWHRLRLQLRAAGDRYRQNDAAERRFFVTGKPQVLLVQKAAGPTPLRSLLDGRGFELGASTVEQLPRSAEGLARTDLIVLEDLEPARLPAELQQLLRVYVEELGGGLLVCAGKAAAELAGPDDVPLEALLPVEFRQVKKKEKIPAALVFVLDRSSSMARGDKFRILLRAVVDTLDRLRDNAQVSVIMFDDFPEVVVPLSEARHRDKIRKVVLAQRVGGGTSIFPALEQAGKQLKKSAAKLKHVILLSDGQSISRYGHYSYIVEKMADRDKITIAAVALGKDADPEELQAIAARSGGRYYFTDSMDNVPRIFTAETEKITETNEVEQTVRAVPAKIVQALAGIDFASAPQLGGYLASEARPTSEVLLVSSDRSEPLLTRWRFGLGKVMVWASDSQGGWAEGWPAWPGFAELWPRLVDDTMRRSPPGDIRLVTSADEARGVIAVRVPAERPDSKASPPRLHALSPRGEQRELELVRRGLGLYRAELALAGAGAWGLRAERSNRRGAEEMAYGSLSPGFAAEYLSAGGNAELLEKAVRIGGGQLDPTPAELFAPGRQKRKQVEAAWPLFVLLAMGCFLAEIMVRRL